MKKKKEPKNKTKVNKYWHYVILLAVIMGVVALLNSFGMQKHEKNIKVILKQDDRCDIQIEEAKNSNNGGHIFLTIKNNSDVLLDRLYVEAELMDNDEEYLNTKYKYIKYLNIGESNRLELIFTDKDVSVARIKIGQGYYEEDVYEDSIVRKIVHPEITEETIEFAEIIGIGLGIYMIIP